MDRIWSQIDLCCRILDASFVSTMGRAQSAKAIQGGKMAQPALTLGAGPILSTPNLALIFWGQFWANNPLFVDVGTTYFIEFLRGQNVDSLVQYISVVTQPWLGSIDIANSLGE